MNAKRVKEAAGERSGPDHADQDRTVSAADEHAIAMLVAAYADCVARGDIEGIVELFARGAVSGDAHPAKAEGREGIRSLYRATLAADGTARRLRVTTYDLAVDIDGTGESATCLSKFRVLPPGTLSGEPIFVGRYADTFARDADGWYFVHRHVHLDETNHTLVAEVGVDLAGGTG